jgi:hypothetical protein
MNSHSKLKTLLTMAKAEEQEFADLEAKAAQLTQANLDGHNDTDEYEKDERTLIAKIQQLPPEKVLKFAEAGEDFNEFKIYCASHSLWKNDLNRKGYHGDNLPALDEEEPECTNLNQYVGDFLFNQWEENPEDLELLDKACEQNIFPALKARCNLNLINLKNNKNNLSTAEINTAEETIVQDLKTINNHYWAPGFIYSFTVFMELAIIHHIPEPTEEDAAEEESKIHFLKCALECELTADLLFNHPTSKAIYNEHGINEWLENTGYTLPQSEQKVLESLAINKSDKIYKDTLERVEGKFQKFKM